MSMKITQEYMDDYVINPMARRFADLEKKIDKLLECKCEPKQEISEPKIEVKLPEQPKPKITKKGK